MTEKLYVICQLGDDRRRLTITAAGFRVLNIRQKWEIPWPFSHVTWKQERQNPGILYNGHSEEVELTSSADDTSRLVLIG